MKALFVLGALLLCGRGAWSNTQQAMRAAMMNTRLECQHHFSSCGSIQDVLNLDEANFCQATKEAKTCALTPQVYNVGETIINGECSQREYQSIEDAACGQDTSPSDSSNNDDFAEQLEQLATNCLTLITSCFNVSLNDPLEVLQNRVTCNNLRAVETCITGNITAGESTACPVEAYNALEDEACDAVQVNASLAIALVLAFVVCIGQSFNTIVW